MGNCTGQGRHIPDSSQVSQEGITYKYVKLLLTWVWNLANISLTMFS